MGDSARFKIFTKRIVKNLDKDMKIADIAGGKGLLRKSLMEVGFSNVETWDKTRNKKIKGKHIYKYFDYQSAPEDYDAVVGMHPDEGTDHILMYAARYRVPAIICPCCIKPSATKLFGEKDYTNWIKHLIRIAENNKMDYYFSNMPFSGRNDILIVRPR